MIFNITYIITDAVVLFINGIVFDTISRDIVSGMVNNVKKNLDRKQERIQYVVAWIKQNNVEIKKVFRIGQCNVSVTTYIIFSN